MPKRPCLLPGQPSFLAHVHAVSIYGDYTERLAARHVLALAQPTEALCLREINARFKAGRIDSDGYEVYWHAVNTLVDLRTRKGAAPVVPVTRDANWFALSLAENRGHVRGVVV